MSRIDEVDQQFDAHIVSIGGDTGDVSSATVTSTGSTTARSSADRGADVVNVKDYGAVGGGVTDDLVAFQAWIDEWNGGKYFFIPGVSNGYLIDGTILYENFHSAVIQGSGRSLSDSTIKQTSGTTAPIFRLGGQTAGGSEPFDTVLRDLSFDANDNNMTTGVIEFGKVNRFELHGVGIRDWDTGAGITNVDYGTSTLFNNMTFRECRLVGFDQDNSVGYNLLLRSTAYFDGGSIELCATALKLTGSRSLGVAHINGVRIERSTIGVHAVDVAIIGAFNGTSSPVKLGQGCVGCDFDLGPGPGSGENQSIVDANFGNRYKNMATHTQFNNYEASPSLDFDGGEWLRVLNANPDPVFRDQNLSGWTLSNATMGAKPLTLPGAHGRAITVTSTAANGYAEVTLYPDDSSDWLLTACFVVNADNDTTARIEVIDQGTGDLWDSGALDYSSVGVSGSDSVFRFVRKRIPIVAGSGGTNETRIRIYSVNNGETTICPLLMFSKSEFAMESDYAGDVTLSGSGVGAQLVYSEVTDTSFTIGNTTEYENIAGAFAHIQTDSVGVVPVIGMTGDTNWELTGPVYPGQFFVAGDAFNLVSPVYPLNSTIKFRGFSGGDITISEVTMHAIGRKNPWGLVSTHEDAAISATTTRVLAVAPAHCVMTRLSAKMISNAAVTASGSAYWTVEIIRIRGGSDTVMATIDSQAGWSSGAVVTLGERNRTVVPGDVIKVVYTKTSTPEALEPTISVNFGWDD